METQMVCRRTRIVQWMIVPALVGGMVLTAGCASTPPPNEQLAVSKTVVENAGSADTLEYAPVELRSARDKLAEAERAMRDKEYVRARRLAEEAEVDARLAQSKANAAKAERAVAEAQESIRVLREELERASQTR